MQDLTAESQCVARTSLCDPEMVDGAAFPICLRHGLEFQFRLLRYGMKRANAGGDELPSMPTQLVKRVNPVVYYLLVDGLIKIGFTTNIRSRLRAYPPTTHLLVTEPGSFQLERSRHRQFSSHLADRIEWFHPAAELWEHIRTLRGDVQDGAVWLDEMCSQV